MGRLTQPKAGRTPSRRIARLARSADAWETLRSKLPTVAARIARIYAVREIEGHGPRQDGSGTGLARKKRRAKLAHNRRRRARLAQIDARATSESLKRQGLVLATQLPSTARVPSVAEEAKRRRVTKREVRMERQANARRRWRREQGLD